MSNKRERFLEGRKRGKKTFRRIHGINPDNEDAVYHYTHPYPVEYVEIPELDDIVFSEEELTKLYKLRDWNSNRWYDEFKIAAEIGVLSNTRARYNCRHECCHNPRRWYKGSKKKCLTLKERSQDEKDKCEW